MPGTGPTGAGRDEGQEETLLERLVEIRLYGTEEGDGR